MIVDKARSWRESVLKIQSSKLMSPKTLTASNESKQRIIQFRSEFSLYIASSFTLMDPGEVPHRSRKRAADIPFEGPSSYPYGRSAFKH